MHRKVWLFATVVLCLASLAQAAVQVQLGNHIIAPNALTTFDIPITGIPTANATTGMTTISLYMLIGDGGPGNNTGGSVAGPTFVEAQFKIRDDTVPTVFTTTNSAAESDPLLGGGYGGQALGRELGTNNGVFVAAGDGILARVTVDASLFSAGPVDKVWRLSAVGSPLDGVIGESAIGTQAGSFGGTATFPDGELRILAAIIPEPSSIVLAFFAAGGIGFVAIRKHRTRRS